MTPVEFTRARQALGRTIVQLATDLDVSPETVQLWETGLAAIPGQHARMIQFMVTMAERAAVMKASGLPECDWMQAWQVKSYDEMSPEKAEAALRDYERHVAGCPVCQARKDYERVHLPPMPRPPMPAWLTPVAEITGLIQRLPAWARPAAAGAAIVATLTLIRAVFVILFRGWDPGVIPAVAGATGIALYVGAVGGIAYQLVRREFQQIGRVGDYLTSIACVTACAAAVAIPWHFIDGPVIRGPAELLLGGGACVLVGLIIGHSWFREPTAAQLEQDSKRLRFLPWVGVVAVVGGTALRFAAPRFFEDSEPTLAELQSSVREDSSDANARRWLGNALADSGRYEEAYEQFSEAVRLDPKDAWGHNGLGWAALNLRRYGPAEAEFRRAMALDSEYVQPRANLAHLLEHQDHCDEAVRLFRELATLDSAEAWPHAEAVECLRRLKRIDEAKTEARAAIRLEPRSPVAYTALIETFMHENRYDSALVYTRIAVKHAPRSARLWALHGSVAYFADQKDEARKAIEKAKALSPEILERDVQVRQVWEAVAQ